MNIRSYVRSRRGLADLLRRKGIPVQYIGDSHLVVSLPMINQQEVFKLLPECEGGQLRLYTGERGGLAKTVGKGTVVCTLDGKPLEPYYIPRNYGGWSREGAQARFYTNDQLVEVTATIRGSEPDKTEIARFTIVTGFETASILKQKLWADCSDDLPMEHLAFFDAVNAAVQKAKCRHCTCVHFRR